MERKLQNEDDILNEEFRKKVIQEIEAEENITRKQDSYKRYEIYRDRIKKYVVENLRRELEDKTVQEMENRTSNINLFKKIVNKKSRVYKKPPKRVAKDAEFQRQLDEMSDLLNIDSVLKKNNRYVEAFYNSLIQPMPYKCPSSDKWKLKLNVLAPWQYDIIEDEINPEIPRVLITSNFNRNFSQSGQYTLGDAGYRDRSKSATGAFRGGNNRNEIIADSPADEGTEGQYIWWSNKYHFTTNSNGEIIKKNEDDEITNPVGVFPAVPYSKQQDGSFWALGGEDLVDGTVLTNVLLTDLYFIAKLQGMGIFYYFGKDVPKEMKIGPNNAITADLEQGDPTPSIGFATSNPPIQNHMAMIEQHIAFLLTTNDMSVSSVSGKLSAQNASSGVHEMIQNSEPMAALEDQIELYRDNEPILFDLIFKWQNFMLDQYEVDERLIDIGAITEDQNFSVEYGVLDEHINEKDRLEIIEKRLDLKLDDMADAMIRDNPDLTREMALEIIANREKEKLEKSQNMLRQGFGFAKKEGEENEVQIKKEENEEQNENEEIEE
jgi:hypothetical protein